jgi:hypothetical protein
MRDAMPYAVPNVDRVMFHAWTDADGAPVGDQLEGWDPQSTVSLSQLVDLDLEGLRTDIGLAQEDFLRISISCTSSDSGMTESLWTGRASAHQKISVDIPGDRVGGVLQLRTTLTLSKSRIDSPPGIVSRSGSVLAEHRHAIRLQGDAAMFPVTIVDFAATNYGTHASWYLHASDDLDAPFLGTFILLINERDTELMRAVASSKPTQAQRALLDEMEIGIAVLMLEMAIDLHPDSNLESYAPDTVGYVLARYARWAGAEGFRSGAVQDEPSLRTARLASIAREHGLGRAFS